MTLETGKQHLQSLVEQKAHLQGEQLRLAREFYNIEGQDADSRKRHCAITQEMAFNAVDLLLPEIIPQLLATHGELNQTVNEIALVAPLRGGLGLVTPATINHLQSRLQELGLQQNVSTWAVGIKRFPKEGRTKVYFSHGFKPKSNPGTLAVIFDWGIATGLTAADTAKLLHNQAGIPYNNIAVVGMTLAEKGRAHIASQAQDGTGQVSIFASTEAKLNEQDYVVQIAAAGTNKFENVRTPKDWGAEMFGMEIEGDNEDMRYKQIIDYMKRVVMTLVPKINLVDFVDLLRYYMTQYTPRKVQLLNENMAQLTQQILRNNS